MSYGLGTEDRNLPSFVVLGPHMPYAGMQIFNNDFLPTNRQGVRVIPRKEPVANLEPRGGADGLQDLRLGLGEAFNRRHLESHGHEGELAARIRSSETAFRRQSEAGEVFDLWRESDETLAL